MLNNLVLGSNIECPKLMHLEQPKPNVDLAKKSPMESNFGLIVHEVLKAQNIVFD